MCTNEDLVFGHGIDEQLNRLLEELPGAFHESDPLDTVVAVLVLDERFGLRQDDDYVLVTPALALWVIMMVVPIDPEIAAAMQPQSEDLDWSLLTRRPFEVKCESPEGPEITETYPPLVRGRQFRLRIMNSNEAEQLSMIYTVRANGTFIYSPEFRTRLLGHTQPDTLDDLVS